MPAMTERQPPLWHEALLVLGVVVLGALAGLAFIVGAWMVDDGHVVRGVGVIASGTCPVWVLRDLLRRQRRLAAPPR